MVVRPFSSTILSESSSTLAAVLGSRGGGVLVQQQQLGPLQGGHQQRQRLALAAGEEPHLAGQTVLQTQPQVPQQLPVVRPLRLGDAPAQAAGLAPAAASARFSSICMVGAVPIIGS